MLDSNDKAADSHTDTNSGEKGQHKHENHKQVLQTEDDDDDPAEVFAFKKNSVKNSAVWLTYFFTLGLLRLFFHWFPRFRLMSTHSRCNLRDAQKVMIVDRYKQKYTTYFVEDVKVVSSCERVGTTEESKDDVISFNLQNGRKKELTHVRAFWYKKLCFAWDAENDAFLQLVGLDDDVQKSELHRFTGFNSREQDVRRVVYGSNEIDVPLESIFKLFVLEALTPFYIFQVFSLIVWFAEAYYYYTIAIVLMSLYGISSSIIQTRRNQKNLKGTVHSTDKVTVSRSNGVFEDIPTTCLVPGDVIVIPSYGCVMHCDAALLNGNCIVNESMLTGESVPVLKTALPKTEALYRTKEDAAHTLFCGTAVIQSRYYGNENVTAVVLKTGFLTSKGKLVRSIMYPPPADFKFDQDSYKFIGILAVVAALGFVYTVVSKSTKNIAAWDTIIKALDLITIVIPPALPAAMTVGKLYALNRLKRKNIYCINSRVINVSGSINCVCFDKTGTLTEDGLDMWGIIPVESNKLQNSMRESSSLAPESQLLRGMVTCHSLTLVDEKLTGDPLDVKMFESTGWILEEPQVADNVKYDLLVPTIVRPKEIEGTAEIGIIHQFQFSSTLQRMSVVVRPLDSTDFVLYCKGSPEMIISLSKRDSVPEDVLGRLREYTEQGYRVIAMGYRVLEDVNLVKIQKMHREDAERDLSFVGLVVLENRLKPQTSGVIEILKGAGMKVVMITGDNVQTAMSVARECGIVERGASVIDLSVKDAGISGEVELDFGNSTTAFHAPGRAAGCKSMDVEKSRDRDHHLAITGSTWSLIKHHFPDEIPKIVETGTIFARMSSDQKQQLIVELQNVGYYVAMCGDGTNDCGALKAAHVGISLSEAEASVASPFTSKEANVECVPEVIKEGRAALVTSFGVFKFMLAYSLTEFISVIILYGIDSNLTSIQFLFIDICLALNFASIFGLTKAYDSALVRNAPTTSLLGFIPIASLCLHLLIVIIFQVSSYFIVQQYYWFVPFVYDPEKGNFFTSYENYAVFSVSMFQYITTAVVFSKGKPYRKPLYTNRYLLSSISLMIAVCAYVTLNAAQWILDVLEMMLPPFYDARIVVCVLALVNFLVAFVVEEVVVDFWLDKNVRPKLRDVEKSGKKYLKVRSDLEITRWPFGRNVEEVVKPIGRGRNGGVFNEAFEIIEESSHRK